MQQLNVFVVNYNGRQTVLKTIRSLYDQEGVRARIHVLDDGSTDGSPEQIKEFFPDIPVYQQPVNTGKPNLLRNNAIKMTDTAIIFITDNDILYDKKCLSELIKVMTENKNVAACVPRLMYWNDPTRIYIAGSKVHYLGTSLCGRRDQVLENISTKPEPSTGGGILLVDRKKILSLGGFDNDYMHGWGEDGEFYQRLMLAGYKSLYVPTAYGFHEDKLSTFRENRAVGQIFNRWQYIITHYSILTLLLLFPALVIYEGMQFLFMLVKRMGGIYFKSNFMALKKIPAFLEKRRRIQKLRRVSDRQVLHSGNIYLAPSLLKNNSFLTFLLKGISSFFDIYWKLVRSLVGKRII